MKFVLKRELRWVLFMLVPFVFLLVIHVMVPLLFITTTTPLLQQSYNIEKKDSQFRTLYSFQQINQQIISARFTEYYKVFKSLNFMIEQESSNFISINTANIQLNNAYNFSQKITSEQLNSSYFEPVSMWFAQNVTSFQQLSDLQKYTYTKYSTVQPYIRSLIPINTSSSIIGVKTHLSTQGETIAFQYPSQLDQQFSQLNSTAFSSYNQLLIDNYLTKNESISVGLQLSSVQISKLSLCTVLLDSIQYPYGVSCLNFDIDKLSEEMYDIINFAHSDYFKTTYSLIAPIIANQNQTDYVRVIMVNQTGGYPVTNETIATSTIVFTSPSISPSDTRITINGSSTTLLLGPVVIEENYTPQSNVLYLGSRNSYTFTSLSNSSQFNNQINLTVGLVAGLVVLAAIISAFTMKTIMNNIDEQLIQLSNYCSYIVEDDLNIEIPSYEGTKDIQQVYQTVKIINRLNKYSHPKYFTGHFINKILLYSQAEKFFKSISYDTGALLQNIGNSYFYMQEVDKTIEYYKQSVRCILTKIRVEYGTVDQIFEWKQQQCRLPKVYREYQVILIRRLFNLIEAYNCLLECHMARHIKENENQLIKDILDYIDLFKKAVYPDYHMYAEFLLVLFYQIKIRLYKGSIDAAQKILAKAEALSEAYINSYAEIGKRMKEKGSKNKLLHMKNKITSHSRMHPEKIKTFRCYFKALVLLKSNNILDKHQALHTLFQGTKVGIFSNRITWMIFRQIHNILQYCNISDEKLFTLSIYNQICPLKNIQEKQFHSQSCPYRYPSQIPKQEQEYIYVVDCLAHGSSQSQSIYFQDRGVHIYQKFIKDIDRVSIIKFHTTRGIRIECNLTMKQSKEQMLRKQILHSFQQRGSYRIHSELFQAFRRVVHRVMKLKSQKIILFFLQPILKYQNHLQYLKKKQRSKNKMSSSMPLDDFHSQGPTLPNFADFGDWVVSVLHQSGIERCKVCFILSENDKMSQFRNFFGLDRVNRKLWKQGKGANISQNSVYVIEDHHKTDLDRILSKRLYAIPDNHIFIL